MSIDRTKVTDSLGVAWLGGKVHLELSRHLEDGGDVYLSNALLLSPDVARRLGYALIEMSDLALTVAS